MVCSALAGAKVAVVPSLLSETAPVTAVAPCVRVKVSEVRVDGFIGMSKTAKSLEFKATSLAAAAGYVETNVGGCALVPIVVPVVNCHVWSAAKMPPAADFAPAKIVAVNSVSPAKSSVGVKTAVVRSALMLTVPAIDVVPRVRTNIDELSGAIAMSKVAESVVLSSTSVAVSAGNVERSVGRGGGAAAQEKRAKVSAKSPPRASPGFVVYFRMIVEISQSIHFPLGSRAR